MRIIVGLLEHMGDIVACEPVTRYLKASHPGSHLTWAVSPPYRELVDTNPYVDDTLVLECLTDWIKVTRHADYELTVDLHVNYRICPDCGIPLVKDSGNPRVTAYDWFDYGTLQEAFAIGAGLPPLSAAPQVYLQDEHRQAVDQLALPEGFCVVHTKSNDPEKDWDRESWQELCKIVWGELKIPIVEVGGGEHVDPPLLDEGYLSLINRVPILQTAEVIRRAKFFVGIDSGPAHLANAVMTPGIVLLGRLGYFRQYMPFNGFFASDAPQVKMVRNLMGPARDLTVAEVADAVRYVSAACSSYAKTPAQCVRRGAGRRHCSASAQIDVEEREALLASGFFDGGWYCVQYPEAASSELDPVDYYLAVGGSAGHAPGPQFDASRYLQMYQDVRRAGINPLLHYVRCGRGEGRIRYPVHPSHQGLALEIQPEHDTTSGAARACSPVLARRGAVTAAPHRKSAVDNDYPRSFAFYLPQFHPVRENDWAHGPGFSEWHNVIKAQPLFRGHYQPRIPGELGFYDLRSPDVLERQIELAHEHGIAGFCFYYYYFQGKRLLYKPIENFLNSNIDFPFFFLWANENWTKRWDGGDDEVIIAQHHSPEDDLSFIRQLLPVFEDPRYVKIEGKPILLIYKTHLFPQIRSTTEAWRDEFEKHGFPGLYLVMVDDWSSDWSHPREQGFDAAYEIPSNRIPEQADFDDADALDLKEGFTGRIVDYAKFARFHMSRPFPEYKRFRTVMLPWDNTARYGRRAIVHVNGFGDAYKLWLIEALLDTYRRYPLEERIVFLHSWNEWCEGTYLEPDGKLGRQFLEQTSEAVRVVNEAIDLTCRQVGIAPAIADLLRAVQAKDEGAFRALKANRAQTDNLWRELRRAQLEGAELSASHAQLQKSYEEVVAQRDSVYASTSWRITGPLRAIAKRLLRP